MKNRTGDCKPRIQTTDSENIYKHLVISYIILYENSSYISYMKNRTGDCK